MYGHLQQIHLQLISLGRPPKYKIFSVKPLAATFYPPAAIPLAAVTCSSSFAAKSDTWRKSLAATTCSDHLQRKRPLAAKSFVAK